MSLVQYFTEQIDKSVAYDGDYFRGMTPEEYVLKENLTVVMPDKSTEELIEWCHSRKAYFDQHLGQKLLFFMNVTNPQHREILKFWTDEFDDIESKWIFCGMSGAIPRLKSK